MKWVIVHDRRQDVVAGGLTKSEVAKIADLLNYDVTKNGAYSIVKYEDVKNDDKIQKVIDAWTIPGPAPQWHYYLQGRLKDSWRTLYDALEELTRGT